MSQSNQQKNDLQLQDLLRKGIFEDEIADMILEKVTSDPEFKSVLEKYKDGEIDEFDFIDQVWDKFNEKVQ